MTCCGPGVSEIGRPKKICGRCSKLRFGICFFTSPYCMYIYIFIFWHEPFGWSISGDHVEVHHPKKGACIYIYTNIILSTTIYLHVT